MAQRRRLKKKRNNVVSGDVSGDFVEERHNPQPWWNDRELAELAILAMDKRFKIAYLLPHVPQDLDEASLFGGYTPGVQEAGNALFLAATFPADVREPYLERKTVLIHRLARMIWPLITPVETTALQGLLGILETPFVVIISTNDTVADEVDAVLARRDVPVLHASTNSGPGRWPLAALDARRIDKYVREVLVSPETSTELEDFVRRIRRDMSSSSYVKLRKHHLPLAGHNLTAPNEAALLSFGWKFTKSLLLAEPIGPADRNPQEYVDRICASADAVAEYRRSLLADVDWSVRDYRYVVAVASTYWHVYSHWRERLQEAPPAVRRQFRHVLKVLVHARTYFDVIDRDDKDAMAAFRVLANERARDMRVFTASLAYLACSTLVPVLRFEPRLNNVRGDLKQLAHCVRHEVRHRFEWKVSRLVRVIGSKMRSAVNSEFLARIDHEENDGRIEGLKLVTDLPLELMPSRGLPVGLRFDCSRLPVTPGNVSQQLCSLPPIHLPLEAFNDVLVVRSFQQSDRLRNLFESAVRKVEESKTDSRVRYRFVDVNTQEELVAAIALAEGAILIFDCHGTYLPDTGMGALVIGEHHVNLWDLRRECHLPPIVMFSACDTQPIDGSHSSVAIGAFSLGARAVLATILPIYADRAALFNARMLFRLDEFLPLIVRAKKLVTWRDVVSGMLRMSHVTEILRSVTLRHYSLSEEDVRFIQLEANITINNFDAGWYEVFLENLSAKAGISVAAARELIDKQVGLTDAMKYVHLGNPERIAIAHNHPGRIVAEAGRSQRREAGVTTHLNNEQ
jgi:hypothetical protein